MNLNCTSRVIKYLLIIFNFLFVITGIILIGVGVSVKTVYSSYHTFLDDKYFSLPNMLIATGSIIFFVSLCGYCGAFKESWVFVGIFSILLILIFIFELSIGIAGYVLRDRTSEFLRTELKINMQKYGDTGEVIIRKAWDTIQEEFQCCGLDSPSDWMDVYPNKSLPISCCPRQFGSIGVFYCNSNSEKLSRTVRDLEPTISPAGSTSALIEAAKNPNTTEPSILTSLSTAEPSASTLLTSPIPESPNSTTKPYDTGCVTNFGNYIRVHASDLAAAGMALAVIQILGVILSFHLAKQLKNGYLNYDS